MHIGSGAATGSGSRATTASGAAMGAAAVKRDTLNDVRSNLHRDQFSVHSRQAKVKATIVFEYMANAVSACREDKLG